MISVVFIFVLGTLSWVLINEERDINLLKQEKIGVEVIAQLQQINILVAQHRGMVNRLLNGNHALENALDELEKQIDTNFETDVAQCQLPEVLLPCEHLSNLQQRWQRLKTTHLMLSVRDSFNVHTLLIDDTSALIEDVANSSHLGLDDDLSTHYLMNSMIKSLPELAENLGQLRGFASGTMVAHHVVSTSEQIKMVELIHLVRLSQRQFDLNLEKIFNVLPEFQQTYQQNTLEVQRNIEQFLLIAEQQSLTKDASTDDDNFYVKGTQIISQVMALYPLITNSLNDQLAKQIDLLWLEKTYILASAGLLSLCLMFFFSQIKKRLNVLKHAVIHFEQISAGNYDNDIIIHYDDEIGQLLSKLQIMRHHLLDNLDKLKYNVMRLTDAQRIAKLGDFDWNLQSNEWYFSDEVYRIFGITTDELEWNYDKFLSFIKAADRDNVAATLVHARCVKGNYDMEYHIDCKNGVRKLIYQCIESHANENGEVIRMVSTLQDVTIQREMETKIKLAAKVFDHVGDAIFVTNENNKITLINRVFTDITGYNIDDVLGKDPRFLSTAKQDDDFYAAMWFEINTHGTWKGEVWNQRKDGSVFPELLTITTIHNSKNEIVNYIGIFSDITLQKQATEQIEYLANYDGLTGLMNRMALQSAVENVLVSVQKSQQLLALLFIDLDGFKAVNDTLGHAVGDEVLKSTAERLMKNVRGRDLVARLGGDEFVVVLVHLTDVSHIVPVADKLLNALHQTLTHQDQTLHVTPSMGISVYSDTCCDYAKLLSSADKAMYKAKENGKNNYQFAP
jgi:diguanylate cyclase (GGDEF)-like protein/PAS domain S-box-containing protein